MTGHFEQRLESLGYVLPDAPPPVGSYLNAVRSGSLLHLSGGLPFDGETKITGLVPTVTSVEQAREAARLIIFNRLAVARAELGSLDQIKRVVSLSGFVSCTPDFYDHPLVINAASDLLVEVFGEAGRHARMAVGVASLPLNASVEISIIFEVAS